MSLIADNGCVQINGAELSTLGVYLAPDGIQIGEAELLTAFAEVPARWGAHDLSATDTGGRVVSGRREIVLSVAATVQHGTSAAQANTDISTAKRTIGALHGTECTVTDVRPGLTWSGRMSVGQWADVYDAAGILTHAACALTLLAQPCAKASAKTVTLTNGGSVSYGGNVETWPTITVTPAAAGAVSVTIRSTVWSFTASSTAKVYVECGRAWAHLSDNSAIIPNLSADWPSLVPGANAIALSNCTASMTYDELVMV